MQAPFEHFLLLEGVKQILNCLGLCPKSVNSLNLPLWDWAKFSPILPDVWNKMLAILILILIFLSSL